MTENGDRSGRNGELTELTERAVALVSRLPGHVRKVSLRSGDNAIDMEWAVADATGSNGAAPQATLLPHPASASQHEDQHEVAETNEHELVRAPLVGTFYVAPQPGAEPFVRAGDIVEAGQTLAIVEAMKLLNHIAAETPGQVAEILVGDGEPVEYGQPLMRVAVLDLPAAG